MIGKWQIATNSTEDQTVYSMTLEQNSTVHDGDITNLKIRRSDGTVLTNVVATTVGDFVTFVFDPPFTILEGDKMTMEVVADIEGGAGDSIIMHFEETSDIFAVGSLYGYGVNGQLYGSRVSLPTETATLPDTVTIDAGEFTLEIDGPAQQSYTRDQNEAVLANIIFTTGGERVDVKKLFVAIQGNTSTGAILASNSGTAYDNIHEVIENVTLRNKSTGRSIDAVRLTDSGTSGASTGVGTYQIYRFDDFIITGKETYEFRVDFIDNGSGNHPKGGDTFKIHICGEPTKVSTGTNTAGCTFGGLIASATTYQMEVEGVSTGDNVHDVRPRGTVTGNSQRIADAGLTVAVQSIGVSDTAVKNSKNINLLRFETRAGEAKDVLVTKFIFAAGSGSLNNGQNYALWVDTDSDGKVDTILEKGVTAQSSKVTFSQLTGGGFVIPKEKTVVFEVHSDISASLTNDDLLLAFSTADSSSYIEAETVDRGSNLAGISTNGTCSASPSTCDITVTTVTSNLWLLVSQGNLFVSQDTTPLRNRQLLGGTLSEAILRLNMRAQHEDIDVTDLQFTSSGSKANALDRLELYKEGATTPFASATVGGCGSDDVRVQLGTDTVRSFCAKMQQRQLIVPKGTDLKLVVKPRLKTDVDGATSGTGIQIFVTKEPVSNNATGSGAVRARGDQSSNNLSANDEDTTAEGEVFIGLTSESQNSGDNAIINSNNNFVVLSKITSITNANPDANGSNIPVGVADIGQFKIAAAANSNSKNGLNKVVLSGVVFNVNATNVAMDTAKFKFYNKANSTVTRACTAMNASNGTVLATGTATASGSFVVYCSGLANTAISTVNATIDQGTDQTFVLQAEVTNPKVSSSATSTLQVSIVNFDSPTLGAFGSLSTNSHFEWVDSDGGAINNFGNSTSSVFRWIEYGETTVKSTSYQG